MCSCVYIRVSVCRCTFTLDCTAWYGCLCVPAGVHLKKHAAASQRGRRPMLFHVTKRDGGFSWRGRGPDSGSNRWSLAENSLVYGSMIDHQQLNRCSLQTESKSRPDILKFSSVTCQYPSSALRPKQNQQYFPYCSTGTDGFLAPGK